MKIEAMRAAGLHHHVLRAYRESGPLQWVRETYKNAEEAGAKRIHYGIEWQAVESKGVYRRLIADDGRGMDAEDLKAFFNTYGGGGKAIGDEHENFGIGAKTSLLPWNEYGVVVISWFDGEPSMIWLTRDPESGEFGLKYEEVEDENGDMSLECVYAPYADEEHGCDWAQVGPSWVRDGGRGTVIVLLGASPDDDTVLGDPNRRDSLSKEVNCDESDIKAISSYLNRRIWEMKEIEVTVDELRTNKREGWPRTAAMAYSTKEGGKDRRVNTRTLLGALHYIDYPTNGEAGIQDKGTVTLADGTKIFWYLWKGVRPSIHTYAAETGYTAFLYKDELYNITSHHVTYRLFGVTEGEVRKRLWLVIKPPLSDAKAPGKISVYPRGDRNALLMRYGTHAGNELPLNDWAAGFANELPEAIVRAQDACRKYDSGSLSDPEWKSRLQERFGSLWKILKVRLGGKGDSTTDPTQAGTKARTRKVKPVKPRIRREPGGSGGTGGEFNLGGHGGSQPGTKVKVSGGLPEFLPVGSGSAVGEGLIAAYSTSDPKYPQGVVYVNVDHPVIRREITEWSNRYAPHQAEEVEKAVIDVYGQYLVAKVAHSEEMKKLLGADVVDKQLRSDEALTMAALGLVGAHAILGPRLGARFTKAKRA